MKKTFLPSFSFLHSLFFILNFVLFFILTSDGRDLFAQSTEIRPGIILPQMTTSQRNVLSATATNGMLVFDTSTQSYWLRSSGAWTELPKTAANTNFWQQTGAAGNEIKTTNSGGFWSGNSTGMTYFSNDSSNPPTAPVSGAGTRMMWIPSRSAFRVGTLSTIYNSIWDAANIGLFSFASGLDSKADGRISTAIGFGTKASGESSTAMGDYTNAIGEASTAMGSGNIASGYASTVMGKYTIASRYASTALGKFNVDNPNAIFMVGNGTYNNQVNLLTCRGDNNFVGIGVDNPIAHLHVGNYGNVSSGQATYFYPSSTSLTHVNTSNANVGIYANQGIVSGTYIGAAQNVVSSDIRIKNIINRSDNVADLNLLKKLQITNYRMKDEGTWGKQIFKKVIAQEVEKIYPEAVSKQTSVIPDIYALAEKVNYDAGKKELMILLSKSYDLKAGDKIELVHSQKGKVRATISAVSDKSFTVKDWLYETDQIFVFGREVDDFRVVDYEALSMLGISAIQALAKQNEALEQKVKNLESRFENLEALLNDSNAGK